MCPGDDFEEVEKPNEIEIGAFDADFAHRMDLAGEIMRHDRGVLRVLAG